ncbi:MAG: EAL domain-containing protein [gamma proteobacterium symbiont of Bathyaustriella thionipta]|nr:EAL domain-containing protein [gamma proteobacterium symbiont of Bathyaustriella thionipta]MCU7948482.1 EAL domain-containing protein [gamma proteobacterium symbiont of Bathyaustriella thionipta]MCU7952706.1 EAL domain-containing protein [gamma proteobacterium symbiont of Bathyaustriella thionipta]MCU7957502.1 EAL domain-containing protein [gamma proteobacterium symbiont of Bathyaustriella thionipta]MCU7966349.1 EAL domain-containing protein [gamma proteobacterium symbiont of Bathyaustriella
MILEYKPLHQILAFITQNIEAQEENVLCSILLLDDEGKKLYNGSAPSLPDFYNNAIEGLAIGEGVGSCGTAAFTGKRMLVEDIQHHPFWEPFRGLAERAKLRSCWSEPVLNSKGKVLGTFALYSRQASMPSSQQLELIFNIAKLTTLAIERHKAMEYLRMSASVYEHSNDAVLITDANNRIVSINPAFSRITGYVIEDIHGQDPHILSSGRQDIIFYTKMWQQLTKKHFWEGELWNRRKDGTVYLEWASITLLRDDNGMVSRHIAVFTDITERKNAEEMISKQANYDMLTNLPNRNLFLDRLEQTIKKGKRRHIQFALLFLDLDNFKSVNDSLGHQQGDKLLTMVARRLMACVRESDTVSRLGGDEFTVLLHDIADLANINNTAAKILEQLRRPYRLTENITIISASIGITVYPNDATEQSDLIRNADQAMYAAKKAGKDTYNYFTASLQAETERKLYLRDQLRQAISNDQFELYYQPIFEPESGKIIEAEALVRWYHPEEGLLGPNEFISVAEQMGLIVPLGDWIFTEACRQAIRWKKLYGKNAPAIAVNKSTQEFVQADCAERILLTLQETGLSSDSIILEITESLLMDENSNALKNLQRFKQAGIKVAIDDFGTGYSSLSYLRRFPVELIKIDRAFITELEHVAGDRALVSAILSMAKSLGIMVVAEGIETQWQLDWLIAHECEYIQGYLIGCPIPANEFEDKFLIG